MKNEKCISCDEIGRENDGVWKIVIFRKFRGSYGKKFSPICHDCLSDALTGYHTGGGLVGSVIKKIRRLRIWKK